MDTSTALTDEQEQYNRSKALGGEIGKVSVKSLFGTPQGDGINNE